VTLGSASPSIALATSVPGDRWDLLMVCVAGYILTAVGRVHQLFPTLDVLRPALLTGLLATVLYLFDRAEIRRAHHLALPTTKLLMAFLVWMLLSIPGALVFGNSVDLVFGSFVKTVLMFLLLAGAVRSIRDVERLVFVYLLAAVVYATVVVTRFDLDAGPDWRLGRLYYYDANDLATFLVTAMPFGLYFLHAARRKLSRMLAVLALAVIGVGFVHTGSRGGFIAFVAVACWIVLRYSAIPLRRRLSAGALIALVVVATASDRYWEQMGTIVSDADYNRTEETGRMQIWSRGVDYMLQRPFFGVGPDNFRTAEGTISPFAERQQFGVGVRWNAAHNSYIQVGAELGFPGLALFVLIIASAFVALARLRRAADSSADPQERRRQLAHVLTASLLGFAIGAFFLSLAYSEMLYTLVGLAVGLQKMTAAAPREGQ
jgi:probable O-glycosylation ligase (exosortase A-associated)